METTEPRGGLLRRALRRFWPRILLQGLILSTALASAAWVLTPRRTYEAVCLLRVDQPPPVLPTEVEGLNYPAYLATQVRLASSPPVLNAVAADPAVAKIPGFSRSADPIGFLRDRLSIGAIPGTTLMQVTAGGDSAADAITLADSLTTAYLRATHEWADGLLRVSLKNNEASVRETWERKRAAEERFLTLVGEAAGKDDEATRTKLRLAEDDLKPIRSASERLADQVERLRFASQNWSGPSRINMARGAVSPHGNGWLFWIAAGPLAAFAGLVALAVFRQWAFERSERPVAAA